jgi:hypothetical protein
LFLEKKPFADGGGDVKEFRWQRRVGLFSIRKNIKNGQCGDVRSRYPIAFFFLKEKKQVFYL